MFNLESRFSVAPSSVMKNRSTFDMPYTHLTTGNFGKLIPFYVNEVLPGDTFDVQTRMFSRMSTPLYPVMDDAWINYYYFFIPARLVWDQWSEFLGENKYSAWTNEVELFMPHGAIISEPGSLADHMGIPTYDKESVSDIGLSDPPTFDVNYLPFRAYWLIWNEWFRNENTTDPILVNTGYLVNSTEQRLAQSSDALLNVSKPFDYFTSALPSPQKGDAVDLPLFTDGIVRTSSSELFRNDVPLRFTSSAEVQGFLGDYRVPLMLRDPAYDDFRVQPSLLADSITDDNSRGDDVSYKEVGGPSNLYVQTSAVTVNQLRQAFQMQRLLELQARSGSRYTEILRSSFGVISPDARLQRPEYLGGAKVHVQMQQVTQQSETTSESPLGKVGAYSKTVSYNKDFTHSFTEHGYIIGVMCARHNLTYQQGLHKMWTRRGRYDLYWPSFAHIGEQPIYNRELFAQGVDSEDDDKVFGYQEAWAEYRYKPNEVTGAFRSTVGSNLDEWHYADYYNSVPILSEEWMEASAIDVDRTLAVSSALHDQLLFDIRVDAKATRVMPLYSIPGLIDHF